MSKEQPNNQPHGIKIATILEELNLKFGWENLGKQLHIKAFQNNATYKSSLKFIRTTPWAKEKLIEFYAKNIKNLQKNHQKN